NSNATPTSSRGSRGRTASEATRGRACVSSIASSVRVVVWSSCARAAPRTSRLGAHQVQPLRELDLVIGAGESVVVVGPSGSGKTTLLQLLGGLDRPPAGSVRFEGRDLAQLGDRELSRLRLATFGFVFQQFNLIPTL